MQITHGKTALERIQRAIALALVAGALALLGWRGATSPDVVWVWQHGDAAWITDPRPVDARVQQWGRSDLPVARFATRFELAQTPSRAPLTLRAARAWRVRVNGVVVGASPDPDPAWRHDRTIDVAPWLRRGDNRVEIDVWHPRGPPLLRAKIALPGRVLPSGPAWTVSIDGGPAVPAVLPDGTRAHPSAPAGPRPARALRARGAALAALWLAAWLGWGALGPWLERHPERAPALALAAVHAAWLALFCTSFLDVPLGTGFDATNHLRFVELLRERHALPLPAEGWSTFHPPLYYALLAALREAAAGLDPTWVTAFTKGPSFAAGLAQVWIAFGLARGLAPGRPALAAVAILFVGALPLTLYTAAYVSNEPLHAAAFGLSTWVCVWTLARRKTRIGAALALGTALGLALLVKVTAVVVAGVAGAALLGRAALVERVRAPRLAALGLAVAGPASALAGWWYLRNWRLYGSPIVANWDLPGMIWWSQPGFRTWHYYLGFGESLRLPVFSGFRSLADSLYSSVWGDGWIAGRASAAFLPEAWDWSWVALGYWLAVPATAVLAIGIVRSVRLAFGTPGRRAAWSFVLALEGALFLAFVLLTLEVPYFGQAKAPYLLGLVAPLSVQFALGAAACDAALERLGGRPAAAAGRALLTATGVVFLLSFAGP